MELTKNEEKKPSPLVEIFLDPNSLDSLSNSLSSTTTSKNPFSTGFSKVFHTRTRFLMMILCLLCLASVWSNILCFNFALICIDHAEGIELESVEQQQQINGSEGEMSLLESVTENESFG